MRTRVSLLLIALYSTKIIGPIVYNSNIGIVSNNSSSKNEIYNLIPNKKNIFSKPVEQIEINKYNDIQLYSSIIEEFVTLIFM